MNASVWHRKCCTSHISLADVCFSSVRNYSSCTFLLRSLSTFLSRLNYSQFPSTNLTYCSCGAQIQHLTDNLWSSGPAFLYLSARLIPPFVPSSSWKYFIPLHTSFQFSVLLLAGTALRKHIIKAILQGFYCGGAGNYILKQWINVYLLFPWKNRAFKYNVFRRLRLKEKKASKSYYKTHLKSSFSNKCFLPVTEIDHFTTKNYCETDHIPLGTQKGCELWD